MNIVLKNANLLHPGENIDKKNVDILLSDGVISKIGNLKKEDYTEAKEFDLTNIYVVPGLFDMHVHLREPEVLPELPVCRIPNLQ